jgi:Nuclease-related domain
LKALPTLYSLFEDPLWLWICGGVLVVALIGVWIGRWFSGRSRRKRLLVRLDKISYAVLHHVMVPDGMGGSYHVDHLLLTAHGILVLDMRRVPGMIFGGDQMTEWTVMTRNRRTTFDNPQPALYDRVAAVKAIAGDVEVQGRVVFATEGKFAKGRPKWVVTLDGLDVDFPAVNRASMPSTLIPLQDAWRRLEAQIAPSPHEPTRF